jgi:hypothetical protein
MRYACPKCKSADLLVECLVVCRVVQKDGFDAYPELESFEHLGFDHESLMTCQDCDFESEAVDFEVTEHASSPG